MSEALSALGGVRVPAEADLPDLVRIMSEGWPEPADEDLVRRQWTTPGFDVATDARLEGAGCAIVKELGDDRVWIDLRGRPSAALIDWAEGRARQKVDACCREHGIRTKQC